MQFRAIRQEGWPKISKKIVVLSPMRDEGWCADSFFESCSLWADHVLVSDQSASDAVRFLAEKYPKVEVMRNSTSSYNELANRSNLLLEGRARFGNSVFISLDADERLTANVLDPRIQEIIRNLPGGTALSVPFANLTPEMSYWEVPLDPIGFSDDGRSASVTDHIHFPRTCISEFDSTVDLGLKILHLQYLDQVRFKSKVDWYKLLEVTRLGSRSPVSTFRRYSHFQAIRASDLKPIAPDMVEGYHKAGVDPLMINHDSEFWWEGDVEIMLELICDRDRAMLSLSKDENASYKTSLGRFDRLALFYLRNSTKFYRPKPLNPAFLTLWAVDAVLNLFIKSFENGAAERT